MNDNDFGCVIDLGDNEKKKILEFREKHKDCCMAPLAVKVHEDPIGWQFTVMCDCGKEEDVTDYDLW